MCPRVRGPMTTRWRAARTQVTNVGGRVVLDTAFVASALPPLLEYAARISADPFLCTETFAAHVVLVLKACAHGCQCAHT